MSQDTSLNSVRIACLQMNSTASVEENLAYVKEYAAEAKRAEVDIFMLPENFAQMPNEAVSLHVEYSGDGPVQDFLEALARQLDLLIIAGSVPIKCAANRRPYARSIVFDGQGNYLADYDKIHLFDVDLEDGQRYRESAIYKPAEIDEQQPLTVVATKFATLGLTICYDLRFPEMYRQLAQLGAQIVTVPAAFTHDTGKAHWQTLLQARAIENQVFIIAAAQDGVHENHRRTWGHSMMIDPWGNVIAQLNADSRDDKYSQVNHDTQSCTGLLIGDIDLTHMEKIRSEFPVLDHRRLF